MGIKNDVVISAPIGYKGRVCKHGGEAAPVEMGGGLPASESIPGNSSTSAKKPPTNVSGSPCSLVLRGLPAHSTEASARE